MKRFVFQMADWSPRPDRWDYFNVTIPATSKEEAMQIFSEVVSLPSRLQQWVIIEEQWLPTVEATRSYTVVTS